MRGRGERRQRLARRVHRRVNTRRLASRTRRTLALAALRHMRGRRRRGLDSSVVFGWRKRQTSLCRVGAWLEVQALRESKAQSEVSPGRQARQARRTTTTTTPLPAAAACMPLLNLATKRRSSPSGWAAFAWRVHTHTSISNANNATLLYTCIGWVLGLLHRAAT